MGTGRPGCSRPLPSSPAASPPSRPSGSRHHFTPRLVYKRGALRARHRDTEPHRDVPRAQPGTRELRTPGRRGSRCWRGAASARRGTKTSSEAAPGKHQDRNTGSLVLHCTLHCALPEVKGGRTRPARPPGPWAQEQLPRRFSGARSALCSRHMPSGKLGSKITVQMTQGFLILFLIIIHC